MTGEGWREVGDGVLVRRHRLLDVNCGLVIGAERCLVVDTRGSEPEGRDLLEAIRAVTRLPFAVAGTHAHFDHCFGNAVFAAAQPGCDIWGHARCREELLRHGEQQRAAMAAWLRSTGEPAAAAGTEAATILPPHRTLTADDVTLPLGGRDVVLHHPGRGHTDHDVVVHVPDAGVTFAGDLVEEGAPPSFDDACPLDWPDTMAHLLPHLPEVVVPGHGDVVDPAFVRAQLEDLAAVPALARTLPPRPDPRALTEAATHLPFDPDTSRTALTRALTHLHA